MTGTANGGKINSQIKLRKYRAGEVIFTEGEPGDVVHILRNGQVEIRAASHSANPQQLAVLHPGDIFGEMALFDNRPRMATAIALADSETIAVSKEEFLKRVDHTDPAVRHLVMLLVHRLRQVTDEFLAERQGADWTHWRPNQAKE
ncbi:MAG: cyclic nucleotide-binding domain-containing protein [Rhodospirillales bacterium]|nr:MAG: cyclic nucleotide-binding domain-containing protein [Rhodospirillales bacterium]